MVLSKTLKLQFKEVHSSLCQIFMDKKQKCKSDDDIKQAVIGMEGKSNAVCRFWNMNAKTFVGMFEPIMLLKLLIVCFWALLQNAYYAQNYAWQLKLCFVVMWNLISSYI